MGFIVSIPSFRGIKIRRGFWIDSDSCSISKTPLKMTAQWNEILSGKLYDAIKEMDFANIVGVNQSPILTLKTVAAFVMLCIENGLLTDGTSRK